MRVRPRLAPVKRSIIKPRPFRKKTIHGASALSEHQSRYLEYDLQPYLEDRIPEEGGGQ